jgi:acyl carrier protein
MKVGVLMVDRVIEIFAGVLGIEAEHLSDETSPVNTPAWDSLSNIMLVTEIEAIFEVELSTSDIESMRSIGQARATLQRLGVSGL